MVHSEKKRKILQKSKVKLRMQILKTKSSKGKDKIPSLALLELLCNAEKLVLPCYIEPLITNWKLN